MDTVHDFNRDCRRNVRVNVEDDEVAALFVAGITSGGVVIDELQRTFDARVAYNDTCLEVTCGLSKQIGIAEVRTYRQA